LTGAANDSAGHSDRRREQSALSKAGWSESGRPQHPVGERLRRFAGGM